MGCASIARLYRRDENDGIDDIIGMGIDNLNRSKIYAFKHKIFSNVPLFYISINGKPQKHTSSSMILLSLALALEL